MRAQEFINEGFIPDHFRKRLAKQGYKFLGQGVDQAAFTVPSKPNIVLKIFGYGEYEPGGDPSHKMFFRWAKFCQKNSSNPFLPKFSGFEKVKIDDEDYIMMYQERLRSNPKLGFAVSQIADLANDAAMGLKISREQFGEAGRMLTKAGVDVDNLYQTLKKLAKIGDSQGYDWDMHSDNVMFRPNGQPVIVDPWV